MDKKPVKVINNMNGMSVAGAGSLERDIVWPVVMDNLMNAEYTKGLFRSYMQKLMDDGRMLRFSEVKKMDILDTTGILPPPNNGYGMPSFGRANEKEKEALRKLGWYAGIPCFEKGAIKLNRYRYIVFEVLEIDPENKSAKISIRDYLKPKDQIWQMGVGATVRIMSADFQDETGQKLFYKAEIESRENFEDLYTLYDAKDLHWSESHYKLWMNTFVIYASLSTAKITEKANGLDQCDSLINLFVLVISRCNAMLEMNRPSRPVKKEGTKGAGVKRKTAYEKGAEPERKTRYVGALCVQSHNVPKKPCYETVVTYKVAKWNVRGHVRHYKSGKDVYIKPGMRTRKALADSNETTATTIRFRKKKE